MFFSREGPNDRKSQVQTGREVGVLKAEYQGNEGFLQRDSVEHKGYAEARSTDCREAKPWTQCPQSDAGSKGIYPRLDWLFSSSRYEADAAVLG